MLILTFFFLVTPCRKVYSNIDFELFFRVLVYKKIFSFTIIMYFLDKKCNLIFFFMSNYNTS